MVLVCNFIGDGKITAEELLQDGERGRKRRSRKRRRTRRGRDRHTERERCV